MALDSDNGEGSPMEDAGPEWDSVEAERDYWKGLALKYGAQLGAIKHALNTQWTVRQIDGKNWICSIDDPDNVRHMPDLGEALG